MKVEIDEFHIFKAGVQFNTVPVELPQKFIATDTTPSVKNHRKWIANNAGATTVTQFDDGQNGQEIKILGDGFTTVANNANIKTNTAANKLLAANKVYTFVKFGTLWVEEE